MALITSQFCASHSSTYAVAFVALHDLTRREELFAHERELFDKKKQEEVKLSFLAGRIAAHEAMAAVGEVNEVLQHESNTQRPPPRWPPSISGSIAHTVGGKNTIGVAIASPQPHLLGIDIEPLSRKISDVVYPRVLNDTESKDQAKSSEEVLLRVFCIKEAAYKALWPAVKQPMSFQDVSVQLEQNTIVIENRLKALHPSLEHLYYKQISYNEMLITVVSSNIFH